jgi:hypothetical protein
MRISAAFTTVNKPWAHHISPNRVQRYPLVTSGAESAMGFHFATVGLTMEELEPLLLGLAMTLGRLCNGDIITTIILPIISFERRCHRVRP